MRLRTLLYALAAGVAAFGLTVVVVVELVIPDVYFSLLVALPVGLVVGAVVAAAVLLLAGEKRTPTQRALAYALGTFGAVLLVVFAGLSVSGLPVGVTAAALLGSVLGVVAGIGVFVRRRQGGESQRSSGTPE
jgi:hypothetical protein